MSFDLVHDMQTSYRKVIDSMSRPGLITNLCEEADKWDGDFPCFPATLTIARLLLDSEVSFKVFTEKEADLNNLFNQLTFSKAAETDQADYIFVLQDARHGDLRNAIEKAKNGSLNDPHHSATIVIETGGISGENELKLMGPGIKGENFVKVQTSLDWMDIREERNAEYPLGIDLIFVDVDHHLLCLPRTVRVMKEETR
ncbi:phosphonate C-P lyase system protein PhnH [Paenibacillus yanchengensis]|uniref:Phosphonate C-P lyase system protein PhnH n=1 Tax=Paenibacillus yanchengensis TaxID=2035833 RepID=A0ABW4YJC2_9BACL